MKREKNNNRLSSKRISTGEVEWNKEVNNLRKVAVTLWQELQTLESVYCLEVKRQINFLEEVRKFEIMLIKRALFQTGGRQKNSARLLGVSTSNLNSKIKRYQIPVSSAVNKLSLAE